jgi:hypothetical protein
MFVFAIATNGKTVAFTKETDRSMLDGILSGDRDEGQQMRSMLARLGSWDTAAPLTARLATESEELDYGITTRDIDNDESVVVYLINGEMEIEPALAAAA